METLLLKLAAYLLGLMPDYKINYYIEVISI